MKEKNRAALYALFLGWLGVHRFYLRQPGLGILYIILVSTGISLALGIIDAIILLGMDPEEFDRRYNDEDSEIDRYRRDRRERRDYRRDRRSFRDTGHRRTEYRGSRRHEEAMRRRRSQRRTIQHEQQRKKVNPYKQSGIKKYKDFDLEAAIEDFKKGLEIEPTDISLHFNIACAYSLTEQADKAYYHLDQAVQNGFRDFQKIKTHDDLAYVRIQPEFDAFKENDFRLEEKPLELEAPKEDLLDDDLLLSQLNRLAELKKKGLITEKEFEIEKRKLTR